jgi:hypothetical protein
MDRLPRPAAQPGAGFGRNPCRRQSAGNNGRADHGSALGFIAPAFASGAASTVTFSGVDALLLASVVP